MNYEAYNRITKDVDSLAKFLARVVDCSECPMNSCDGANCGQSCRTHWQRILSEGDDYFMDVLDEIGL